MFLPACRWWGVWSLSHARPVIHNLEADSAAKKIVRPFSSLERDSKQVSRRCFIGGLFARSCSNIIRVLWRFIWAVFYCFRMPLSSLSSDSWGMLKAHSDMDRCLRCPLFNLSVWVFFRYNPTKLTKRRWNASILAPFNGGVSTSNFVKICLRTHAKKCPIL